MQEKIKIKTYKFTLSPLCHPFQLDMARKVEVLPMFEDLSRSHLDEFETKFEKDYSLVSFLYTSKTTRSVWYLDSGASLHMEKERELFSSMMERDSNIHV
jgi:hypothetical protein